MSCMFVRTSVSGLRLALLHRGVVGVESQISKKTFAAGTQEGRPGVKLFEEPFGGG